MNSASIAIPKKYGPMKWIFYTKVMVQDKSFFALFVLPEKKLQKIQTNSKRPVSHFPILSSKENDATGTLVVKT